MPGSPPEAQWLSLLNWLNPASLWQRWRGADSRGPGLQRVGHPWVRWRWLQCPPLPCLCSPLPPANTISPLPNFFGPLSFHSPGFFVAASQLQVKSPSISSLAPHLLTQPFHTSLLPALLLQAPSPVTPMLLSPLYPCPGAPRISLRPPHPALPALRVDLPWSPNAPSGRMCPYDTTQLWQIWAKPCVAQAEQSDNQRRRDRAKPDLHLFVYPVQEGGGSAVDTRLVLFCTAHSEAGSPHQLPDTRIFAG